MPLIGTRVRQRAESGIGGNGDAERSASTALAPSALSSVCITDTLLAEPAASIRKRSLTFLFDDMPAMISR